MPLALLFVLFSQKMRRGFVIEHIAQTLALHETSLGIAYRLDVFEGPLDLLLHLIKKNQLQIDQIDITILLTQYLEYMAQMRSLNLEIASEFLAMAAHLVYIKTISLLPPTATAEEADANQLKQELSGQLIEYNRCQQVAARLSSQFLGNTVFVRPPTLPKKGSAPPYQNTHPVEMLTRAYLRVLGKGKRRLPLKPVAFSALVSRRVVSVESRISFLLERLSQNGTLSYASLFPQGNDRSEMIATFLAMLELVKDHRIHMKETGSQWFLEHPPTSGIK